MIDNSKTTGLASYQGPKAGRAGPRDVLALLQEKCRYRAMIEELQEKIDMALPHLDQQQTQELLSLMAEESSDNIDIVQIQQEAVQAAAGIHPIDIKLTRPATKALKNEVIRRLSAGHYCPPTELLVAEAVRKQFERR